MKRSITQGLVQVTAACNFQNAMVDDILLANVAITSRQSQQFTNGEIANTFNRAWSIENGTLPDASSLNINLASFAPVDIGGGAGNDSLGQAVDFLNLTLFLLSVDAASAGSIQLASGSGVTWLPNVHTVTPGAQLLVSDTSVAGLVVPGTNGNVGLSATGGDVTYNLIMFGRGPAEV